MKIIINKNVFNCYNSNAHIKVQYSIIFAFKQVLIAFLQSCVQM